MAAAAVNERLQSHGDVTTTCPVISHHWQVRVSSSANQLHAAVMADVIGHACRCVQMHLST